MRIAVVGLGATGSHVARQLVSRPLDELMVHDRSPRQQSLVAQALRAVGPASGRITAAPPDPADPPDVVVLAVPVGQHVAEARRWIEAGAHVVSVSDGLAEVEGLLALDGLAGRHHRSLVVGAGFVPGLSCVLARVMADRFDEISAVAVFTAGTGGPACARQHHRALKSLSTEWRDGVWRHHRGGSGRELTWFPDPFGARDCYRAALPSPVLLQRALPEVGRITARMAATRRDRFTSWLPMLFPPHRDGGPGAVRVELRGRRNGSFHTEIVGSIEHPSVAGGVVAAVAAIGAAESRAPIGADGVASWPDPARLFRALREHGVRAAVFSGADSSR
ncbi:MAG: NAD(P)-binding domain-containing protein [Acidimicrobiales bacterium]